MNAIPEEIELVIADAPLPKEALNPAERAQYSSLSFSHRREQWLKGRQALRRLGERRNHQDLGSHSLPHDWEKVSLTYNAGRAIAASCRKPCEGFGIDAESLRHVCPRLAGLFLTAEEWDMAQSHCLEDSDFVRLWTVKEALYKASSGKDASGGLWLRHYKLKDLRSLRGEATRRDGLILSYQSLWLDNSTWLTIATHDGKGNTR